MCRHLLSSFSHHPMSSESLDLEVKRSHRPSSSTQAASRFYLAGWQGPSLSRMHWPVLSYEGSPLRWSSLTGNQKNL